METNINEYQKMTDKEKADCFIQLHKDRIDKFKQTREIEFKINLALWTFILVSGYYLKQQLGCAFEDIWKINSIFIIIGILIVIGHFWFWMKPIQKSENNDAEYSKEYRKIIYKLTSFEVKENEINSKSWIIFEICITILLLFIVFAYINL